MSPSLRIIVIAIAVALIAILAFPAFLALRGAGTAVFEPERFDFVLLGAAAFGITLGALMVPWRRARRVALLAVFASAALLFAFIAAFSIGVAFLPAGIVLMVVLFRAVRRDPSSAARAAALGGAAIGYSGVLLVVALLVPATVECRPNSVSTSSRRWPGSAQQQLTSKGGGGSQPGVYTGIDEYADSVMTYRCEGGRLVEFQRTPR